MKNTLAGALLALGLALAGCTTIAFYAPEGGPSLAPYPIESGWLGVSSVLGVSLRSTHEAFTVGKHVGGLFDGAYAADHSETWSVSGPGGYQGTIQVVQTGIRYGGSLDQDRLKVSSSDWSQVTFQVKVTDSRGTWSTEPAPWKSGFDLGLSVGTTKLTPYYVGKTDEGVVDYRSRGLVTGYQIHDGDRLVGYLDALKSQVLLAGGDPAPDPRLVGLVLWAARGRSFVPNPVTLEVESLSINLGTGTIGYSR